MSASLWRRGATLIVGALLVTGCAIRAEDDPHEIGADRERELLEPLPETPGQPAVGDDRIYLVGEDGQHLVAVARSTDGTETDLFEVLFDGPNDGEVTRGYRSAIPANVELNSVRVRTGVVDIDVSEQLLELSAPQLELAIGQLVMTADQLVPGGPADVIIRLDGSARDWPSDTRRSEQRSVLTRYDFVGIVDSAQPAYPQRSPVPQPGE